MDVEKIFLELEMFTYKGSLIVFFDNIIIIFIFLNNILFIIVGL